MSAITAKPKVFNCFITHITTDRKRIEIWSQSNSSSASRVVSALEANHKQLSDLFANKSLNRTKPRVGNYYVTHMNNDLHFYRSVVTHYEPNDDKALVLFIDFGNEEWVPINNLIVFDSLFNEDPLAYKYVLADIKPKDKKKGWDSDKVKQSLDPFIGSVFQCETIHTTDNTEHIRVYDSHLNQPLVEKLIEECDAILVIKGSKDKELSAIETRVPDIETVSVHLTQQTETNSYAIKPDCYSKQNEVNDSTRTSVEQIKLEDKIVASHSTQSFDHLKTLLGIKKSVYITSVLSTKSVYCQISDKFDEIEDFLKRMTRYYNQFINTKDHELNPIKAKCGDLIAAQFNIDQNWYRASIRSIDDNLLNVFYIDFGNEEQIELKYGKQLAKEFKEMPPQAMHCSPININLSYSILSQYEADMKQIECEFVELEGDLFKVRFYENGKVMSHEQKNPKKGEKSSVSQKSDSSLKSDKSSKKTRVSDSTNAEVNKIQAEVKIDSTHSQQIARICDSSLKLEPKVNDLTETETNNVEVNKIGLQDETVLTESSKSFTTHIERLVGSKRSVYISCSYSAKSVYCQIAEKFDEIEDFVKRMTEYYTEATKKRDHLTPNEVKNGDIIAAQFSLDERWYRACVQSIDNNLLEVFYIDYGNKEKIDIKFGQKLAKEFEEMPPQAMHCSPINANLSHSILSQYEADMNQIECEFVELEGDLLKVRFYENGKVMSQEPESPLKSYEDSNSQSNKSSPKSDQNKEKINETNSADAETIKVETVSTQSQQSTEFDNSILTSESKVSELTETGLNKIGNESNSISTHSSQRVESNDISLESDREVNDSVDAEVKKVEVVDQNVLTYDPQSVTTQFKNLIGTTRSVYISFTVSTKSIYVQFADKFDEIESLVNRMTQFYNESIDAKDHELNPAEAKCADIIAAKFSVDQSWYRASIRSIDDNLLKVFYIDFGNEEQIEFKFGKQLVEEFYNFPAQAMHCSPINESLNLANLKQYETDTKEIECEFIDFEEGILKVRLHENGKVISQEQQSSGIKLCEDTAPNNGDHSLKSDGDTAISKVYDSTDTQINRVETFSTHSQQCIQIRDDSLKPESDVNHLTETNGSTLSDEICHVLDDCLSQIIQI